LKARSLLAAGALVSACLIATPARAGALMVTANACPSLDASEVERILKLELSQVSDLWADAPPLRVELACEGNTLHATAIDTLTDKRLSRDVALGRVKDRDRTVALLVSQLFLTSWTELMLKERPPTAPTAAAEPAKKPDVAQAAEALARRAMTNEATWGFAAAALVGPRVHVAGPRLVGSHGALRPGVWLGGRASMFLEIGYERGSTTRSRGDVGFTIATLAAGVGTSLPLVRRLALDAHVSAGASLVDVRGEPVGPSVVGASASGVVGDLALGLGPSLHLGGGMHLALELAAGERLPAATARVAGDDDVRVGGPWVGASLVLGYREGGR
jgi:hypothetical protein